MICTRIWELRPCLLENRKNSWASTALDRNFRLRLVRVFFKKKFIFNAGELKGILYLILLIFIKRGVLSFIKIFWKFNFFLKWSAEPEVFFPMVIDVALRQWRAFSSKCSKVFWLLLNCVGNQFFFSFPIWQSVINLTNFSLKKKAKKVFLKEIFFPSLYCS